MPRLILVTFSKVFGIALDNLFNDIFNVFLASKGLIVNIFLNLFVKHIILKHKIDFHKLLKRLLECYIVNLSI